MNNEFSLLNNFWGHFNIFWIVSNLNQKLWQKLDQIRILKIKLLNTMFIEQNSEQIDTNSKKYYNQFFGLIRSVLD